MALATPDLLNDLQRIVLVGIRVGFFKEEFDKCTTCKVELNHIDDGARICCDINKQVAAFKALCAKCEPQETTKYSWIVDLGKFKKTAKDWEDIFYSHTLHAAEGPCFCRPLNSTIVRLNCSTQHVMHLWEEPEGRMQKLLWPSLYDDFGEDPDRVYRLDGMYLEDIKRTAASVPKGTLKVVDAAARIGNAAFFMLQK